jgi:hypothetical protein
VTDAFDIELPGKVAETLLHSTEYADHSPQGYASLEHGLWRPAGRGRVIRATFTAESATDLDGFIDQFLDHGNGFADGMSLHDRVVFRRTQRRLQEHIDKAAGR